jgi:protein SCO1/2
MRYLPILLALVVALGLGACGSEGGQQNQRQSLPVLGKKPGQEKPTTIPDFELTNQYGRSVSQEDLEGKVYVADFFFTTCPTICPKMTEQMQRVHEAFRDNPRVVLLSHSIDPDHDSAEVLRRYAERHGVEKGSGWHFLTGDKERIYELAEAHYLVSASEDESAPGGYAHSGAFVLIDPQDRIRGYYDGTNPEDVDRLIADIRSLLEASGTEA